MLDKLIYDEFVQLFTDGQNHSDFKQKGDQFQAQGGTEHPP